MKRRNTPSTEAVLEVLQSSGKAMSQDTIEKQMKVEADRATVYRILNRFCDDGLVHRIVADDGKQYFAVCTKCDDKLKLPENHFHFRCTRCQTIECLTTVVSFSVPEHYQVHSVNCVLVGLCKDCSV